VQKANMTQPPAFDLFSVLFIKNRVMENTTRTLKDKERYNAWDADQ
jgi:hypothetical protein